MRETKQLCLNFIEERQQSAEPVPGNDGKFHGLYIIVNQVNMKFYVGKHTRKTARLDLYFGSGFALNRAITKYGRENFKITYFQYFNTAQELHDKETDLLKYLLDKVYAGEWGMMIKFCYNLRMNEGFNSYSEETRVKISANNWLAGNGHLRVGKKNPNFGRVGANAGKFGFQHPSSKGIIIGINSSQEVVAFNGNADIVSRKTKTEEFFQYTNISTVINGRQETHRGFRFFRTKSVNDIQQCLDSETFYDTQSREVLQSYLNSVSIEF